MAPTAIHLDKSRNALDMLLRMKGPEHTLRTHYIQRRLWERRPSLGGRYLKARRLCLHSFAAAVVLIPHCYCQVMEHFRQITEACKGKHREKQGENKHHLRCFCWQICIAFNQGSNSTVNKSPLYSRWQLTGVFQQQHHHHTATSATRLCQIKYILQRRRGFSESVSPSVL